MLFPIPPTGAVLDGIPVGGDSGWQPSEECFCRTRNTPVFIHPTDDQLFGCPECGVVTSDLFAHFRAR